MSTCAPLGRTSADGVMLVGDAARMTDPISGGGINHACIQGRFAGEVAAEAVEANDSSASFLTKYENRWRERFEETLFRNWMIKEKITTLTDSQLNMIVSAISDYDWEKVSVGEILDALREKLPDLQDEIGEFLGF